MSTQELNAHEIFEQLLKGNAIQLPLNEDSEKLFNYLNVIKSRSKKLYDDLGLEFENFVIKKTVTHSTFMILEHSNLKPNKKFTVFIIDNDKSIKL